jgi:hypothetical protein
MTEPHKRRQAEFVTDEEHRLGRLGVADLGTQRQRIAGTTNAALVTARRFQCIDIAQGLPK